ncbi:MAG: hypothetical protein WCF84_25895 [Anaerolineae bacterium]
MAKKRKQYYEPDLPDDEFEDLDEFLMDPADVEADVLDLCGKRNAARGMLLYKTGMVLNRSFDGAEAHATIKEAGADWIPSFNPDDFSGTCGCPTQVQRNDLNCEHVAALIYAFESEPQTFIPKTLGGVINLMMDSPDLRAQLGVSDAEFERVRSTLQSSPEVRQFLDRLPADSQIDTAAARAQLQAIGTARQATELQELLAGLTLEQLREIATRRGWKVPAAPKAEIVAALAEQLRRSPAPERFAPEEEQLLSIQNTVSGLSNTPLLRVLQDQWKKRGGGDLNRLDRAMRSLIGAGVLFPCTRENSQLHYHWSPFLDAASLPLLHPRVEPYKPEKAARLDVIANSLPFPDWVSAVTEVLRQEPLELRRGPGEDKVRQLPYVGKWDYVPEEIALIQTRYFGSANIYEGISVPLAPALSDAALDLLGAALQTSLEPQNARDFAAWMGEMLITSDLVRQTGAGKLELNPGAEPDYQALGLDERYRHWWQLWQFGGLDELRLALTRTKLALKRSGAYPITPEDLVKDVGLARRFIARLLAGLDPMTWYSWDSIVHEVRDLRPDFLHSTLGEAHWWLTLKTDNRHLQTANPKDWNQAYAPVLQMMFEGALTWLGAVQLGYQNRKPVAFQITGVGAWLFSGGKTGTLPELVPATDEGAELVTWLDSETFRIRAGSRSPVAVAAARLIADPVSGWLTFHISNPAMARSFERGHRPDEIVHRFTSAGVELPAAVRERLDALYLNYGRVHVYERLTVLELGDDYILRELLASTSLRRHVVHQFSARVIVMRDEAVPEFLLELDKKGYTPRILETGQVPGGQ